MIEIRNKKTERAMLIAVQTRNLSRELVEEHLSELEELADTAGADSIFKIIQSKTSIDPAFYIGKGKAEELAQLVELNDIDLVISDDDLTPVQVRNLEKLFNRKIIDRSGLILDIFALRAKTKEAKTQVELAQLEYMLPRLTRAWTHLSKQYGGIGTKGPGETQIETDRRMIRTRISHLKEKLKDIESQRQTQSKGRKDFVRISIAGYTNAGKSTLFNLLTKADVFAEDKLFATLDSTTRTISFSSKDKILISDTVGFIRKLPAHLVASFKSTLNEVRESDIILHMIDLSHPYYEDHLKVVEETLKEFDSEHKKEIKVFNKVDSVTDKSIIEYVRNKFPGSVIISAMKGINISSLVKSIENVIKDSFVEQELTLGIEQTKLASQIHDLAEVISVKYNHDTVLFKFRANKENSEKIKKLLTASRLNK
ncbi:MAG: GTPase HflX [Ignavibacteriaceae bacterium]|nr:GTPase HflX [Ignavibacteriaceae bacterium]